MKRAHLLLLWLRMAAGAQPSGPESAPTESVPAEESAAEVPSRAGSTPKGEAPSGAGRLIAKLPPVEQAGPESP